MHENVESKVKNAECGSPTKLKFVSYILDSTRKLVCELEHHRSHKKEVNQFLDFFKSWKFMGCCTIYQVNFVCIIS